LRGTAERALLPPFYGPPPARNGQSPVLAVEPPVEDVVLPVERLAEVAAPEPVDAPSFEAEPELSGWFTNGLADVALAEEGVEVDVSDGEPVYQTDTSVPAELVFADEGVVEPVFEEDVHATEEMLAESARGNAEFPMDAFIIPEDAERLPTGVAENGEAPETGERSAAGEIAARFENISKLLREEDVNELLRRLARGDKLDALLAGLLAGYLSTHDA